MWFLSSVYLCNALMFLFLDLDPCHVMSPALRTEERLQILEQLYLFTHIEVSIDAVLASELHPNAPPP